MVELLAPGVYTIETSFRSASIQGVGTSTTGFVGLARNGPRAGPPRLVTSFGEFERLYGGLADLEIAGLAGGPATNYLAMAVRGFFNEGGSRLYISAAFLARPGSDGLARAALVGNSDADARHLILRSRFPGSGANGSLQLSEIVSPATAQALSSAPVGSLARTRGRPSEAAAVTAVQPPGELTDGMTLSIGVDGAAAQEVTFNGGIAMASAQVTTTTPISIPPNTNLVVTIDGQAHEIPLTEGENRPVGQIRNEIDAALTNGTCTRAGNRFRIRSAAAGSGVTVTVEQLDLLGFTQPLTEATGTGMRRLDDVRAADLNLVFGDAGIGVTVVNVAGTSLLQMVSNTSGAGSAIDLSAPGNAAALTALGFDPAELGAAGTGVDGVARRIFIRASTAAAGWQEYGVQPDASWATTGGLVDASGVLTDEAHLVTLNLAWESVDGVTAAYEGLGFDETHPRYFGHRMATVADPVDEPLGDPLVLAEDGLNAADVHAALFAGGRADESDVLSNAIPLAGGNDGTVPGLQTVTDALGRLNLIDDIAIVAAPGSSAYPSLETPVRNLLIGHAQDSNFRIAVCDPPPRQQMAQLRQTRGTIDNTYAAFYAPWIRVANPRARPGNEAIPRELTLPPSGHICGIYARNDSARGVWKTPANEIIREAIGFETDYNQRHQEVLNPIGINVLRYLTGRGNRVYGGRLATSDMEIKYVSDRRYLNFLKGSIYQSMQWAVFEPNGPELWTDVREAVTSFLFNQWRNGALLGATPEVAFFVRCDRSVITQDDLDNGRLICEIGAAIVKPAEFLVFRIGQKTADARS
ncbi:phage tail sheath subtilisin-like domain-containing protein [Poseidonocella sp. HB161398]|uniref:phage tail sheath family protein n=1 Tax=Poseidonocella sp. HB161398 TaxID=2320855 RepID=UPI00197DB2E8|nr:phage tail sheath subtilisin-like domain-containing protein [Poseidonocella sp. HB161398]